MKHANNVISLSGNPLLQEVYIILDSRIQYIEYQAQNQFKFRNSAQTSDCLINNFEQMLTLIKELNHRLKLLQILKSWLKDDTVQIILQLLTNKKYLKYSEKNLEEILKDGVIPKPVYS